MQCYFITQAVDILYGTLRARGLADYGTEGIDFILTPRCGIPEEIISSGTGFDASENRCLTEGRFLEHVGG